MRNFGQTFEDGIGKIFAQFYELDSEVRERLFNATAYYISQHDFKAD